MTAVVIPLSMLFILRIKHAAALGITWKYCIAKQANVANNDPPEMQSDSPDGGEDAEYTGIDFEGIANLKNSCDAE